MSNKFLGILALIGAPSLVVGMFVESQIPVLEDSWFTGVWGILYITGWMASMIVLQRVEAGGKGWFGKGLIATILVTLMVANVSNLIQLISADNKPPYFFYLDLGWPLSNVLMLVLGITILIKKSMNGRSKYIALVCGLWLPFAMLTMMAMGKNIPNLIVAGGYSAIAWTMLAWIAFTVPRRKVVRADFRAGRRLPNAV